MHGLGGMSNGKEPETLLKTLNFDVLDKYAKTLIKLGPVCTERGEMGGRWEGGGREVGGRWEGVGK